MSKQNDKRRSPAPDQSFNFSRWSDELERELGQHLELISVMIRTRLWAQILLAMILGLGLGLLISPKGAGLIDPQLSLTIANWMKLPGSIFLNLIQMVVIPLVLSSIILGICSSGDPAHLRRVGLRILPYFVVTTSIAVALGALLSLTLQPGGYIDQSLVNSLGSSTALVPEAAADPRSLPERLADLIPANIDQAFVTRDMLQIVIYAIIFGVAIVTLPSSSTHSVLRLLENVQDLSLKVVGWAMMLAPYAVFGLLGDIAIRIGLDAIIGMSAYVGTVMLGLLMLLVVYLVIVAVVARSSPLYFLRSVRDVQLLAFSTSSSAAVMPLSMQTAEEKLGVHPSIAKFIVPLGATVNMDGTALYQVVAAVFLTQVFGVELSTGQLLLLAVTTVGASIGSPSTPGVGIVILATILQGIGVPPAGIALILGVDRILDMCRTTVNVSGDLTACLVMNRWLADTSQPEQADAESGEPEQPVHP